MKRQELTPIIVSCVGGAILALVLSSVLINGRNKEISVPIVEKISSDFPDVQHDPSYTTIFNPQALDPTQTITIGQGQNGQPFSGN